MIQCFTCMYIVMDGQKAGKWVCFRDVSTKVLDVLERRDCNAWKLGSMQQVRRRTVRNVTFDAGGMAVLK